MLHGFGGLHGLHELLEGGEGGPRQQVPNNNGIFRTTPGYDMATGIGTPRMAALITGS